MSFSFTVNWHVVFHPDAGHWLVRFAKFVAVTCASSYGLQSLVIHWLSLRWRWPIMKATAIVENWPFASRFSGDSVDRNLVKAVAVFVGLIWNFLWYRCFVYR